MYSRLKSIVNSYKWFNIEKHQTPTLIYQSFVAVGKSSLLRERSLLASFQSAGLLIVTR